MASRKEPTAAAIEVEPAGSAKVTMAMSGSPSPDRVTHNVAKSASRLSRMSWPDALLQQYMQHII